MRIAFAVIFILLSLTLGICVCMARRSYRKIGKTVSVLVGFLIPPMLGNLLIVLSGNQTIATIGCYIYFIGMDLVLSVLLRFTFDYCMIKWPRKIIRYGVYCVFGLDILQLLLNTVFGHAFSTEAVLVDGFNYYRLIPYWGQTIHRVVDYTVFLAVLIIFIAKIARSPKIYMERYFVILATMLVTGGLQTYYIFSRTPVDQSMAGYGIFGLLIYYFTLQYRPMSLLDRMLSSLASEIPDGLFLYDVYGKCIWANEAGTELIGIKNQQFDQAGELLIAKFGEADIHDKDVWDDTRVLVSGTEVRYYSFRKSSVSDEKKVKMGSYLIAHDITNEKTELQRQRFNATHDTLTQLYNKEYLYECIRDILKANPDEQYCVIFVDLMDFRLVNDVFGHAFGDFALKTVAAWLKEFVPQEGVFGRLGGDTFGVLMPVSDFHEDEVEEKLSQFIINDGTVEHNLLIHLGIYEVRKTDMDVSTMFDRAHMALSGIKEEYQIHVSYYDEELRNEVLWAKKISAELPDALAKREIQPFLQPIVDKDGKVVGLEALARWIHPKDGFLSPAKFIPVFERNGMIVEVDKYMWRCACEILAGWGEENKDLFISVNISPKDFYFMDVTTEIRNLAKEFKIDPARLRIEITETVMMNDVDNRMKKLNSLKELGFVIEMDDFGSGYSSLNLLKDMPVDVLKIDMRFLNRAKDDEKARRILQNIMNLSEDLGIASLTEGVETKPQLEMLCEMGCKLFQGYLFAKPMPLEEVDRYLNNDSKC